jgi:hypothetical protein
MIARMVWNVYSVVLLIDALLDNESVTHPCHDSWMGIALTAIVQRQERDEVKNNSEFEIVLAAGITATRDPHCLPSTGENWDQNCSPKS